MRKARSTPFFAVLERYWARAGSFTAYNNHLNDIKPAQAGFFFGLWLIAAHKQSGVGSDPGRQPSLVRRDFILVKQGRFI